jgi:ABC-2 type transport system ATP-binding protein
MPTNPEKPVIQTENLTKYYGKNRGIEDVNLKVREGEIFGFIGPNGAGKSTSIRVLLSLIYPTSGVASIFGMDIVRQAKDIKRLVGFMPSEVNYYEGMNTRELLEYSASFYGKDCSERINELADIFDVDLRKEIFDLSMGNKKKVSILQSLIHQPKLLILDEPTSGLDPLMQSRFFDVLREENSKGTTIFFSSHILSEVQKLCKRVAIIKDGSIVQVEDIDTLRQKQLKKVALTLSSGIDEDEFRALSGVSDVYKRNSTIYFLYADKINRLLEVLVEKDIQNLTIEEPDLEEIFMHYYTN